MLKFFNPDLALNGNMSLKIKMIIVAAHLVFLSWLVFDPSWIGALWAVLGWIVFGKMGGEVGIHRYFSHRSFKTNKFWDGFLLVAGSANGLGSPIGGSAVHRHHHANADTDKDPHSPHNLGLVKTWLTLWGDLPAMNAGQIKDLLRDKKQVWMHQNYFKFMLLWIIASATLSLMIQSWIPILFFWAGSCVITFNIAGFVDGVCHKYGYAPYDVNDQSKNNLWLNPLLLGSGLHNNHHGEPGNWNCGGRGRWYEVDPMSWFIRFIKI
jgi:stearoyl-CoA desaturase (delta-9 desaturase)